MKTLIIGFVLISILTGFSYTQTKSKLKNKPEIAFFGLSVGPSFPSSDFGNKDVNLSSGYATVGYKVEAYGGVNIIGVFGLSALGFVNINGTNTDKLVTNLNNTYPDTSWNIDSRNWELYGGMGGVSFYYPVNKKLTMDIKLLSGLLSAKSPELAFISGNNSYKIESSTVNSISWMTSIGLLYYLGQNVSLTGAFEYLGSDPKFNNVKTTLNVNGISSETTTTFSRVMTVLNLSVGFRYSIR